MKQKSLRQEAKKYLQNNRQGSPRIRRFRQHVINQFMIDLYALGNAPMNWSQLNNQHLMQITKLWHKRKVKPSTMINHMTVIRNFLEAMGNSSVNLNNQQLGIKRKSARKKTVKLSHDFWKKIDSPVAKVIIAMQVNFGLTYSEAIRLKPQIHLQENQLWLTREITFNSQDRIVPIRNESQIRVLSLFKTLTGNHQCLLLTFGESTLRFALKQALAAFNLTNVKCWRYLYAQWLHNELFKVMNHYKLNWLIMDELGLKSRTSLWRYLHES